MKVAIIGNSGSGKSTLARNISETYELPMLDLDTVAWEPGTVAVPREPGAALAVIRAFCTENEGWVVEGCYTGLIAAALEFRPVLIFLDPGIDRCIAYCRSRPWEPHKYASKEEQDARLEFLLSWVAGYYDRMDDMSLIAHQSLFERYAGPKVRLDEPDAAWHQQLHRWTGSTG